MSEPNRLPATITLPQAPRRLPPDGSLDPDDLVRWAAQMTSALRRVYDALARNQPVTLLNVSDGQILQRSGSTVIGVGGAGTYTPTNDSADRAFDASTVGVTELANVVATLLRDLRMA